MLKKLLTLLIIIGSVVMSSSCGNKDYVQLKDPSPGDDIAIIKTNMGDITVRFFPEYAPKAVENFITHAKDGYYDGVIFHRVIENFMIQSGDPTGTGMGGESIWGKPFEDEGTVMLHNIRGALSMANSGRNTNGSQFFIVQNYDIGEQMKAQLQEFVDNPDGFIQDSFGGTYKVTDKIPVPFLEYYIEHGGALHLDSPGLHMYTSAHTVFGQVIDGMDIVDKIAAVETSDSDKPLEDIVIETIIIDTYKK